MWLWRFASERDGEPRWALQREEGGPFEVIRRRSSGDFVRLCRLLGKGEKGIEKLAIKRGVEALPGRLLIPARPSKIVCIGLNYRKHAEEMNKPVPEEPLLFMKPVTSLLAHGGEVVLPRASQEVHFEGELAIVVLIALPLGALMGHGLNYLVAAAFSTDLYQIPVVFVPSGHGLAAAAVVLAAFLSGWIVRADLAKSDFVAALKTRE